MKWPIVSTVCPLCARHHFQPDVIGFVVLFSFFFDLRSLTEVAGPVDGSFALAWFCEPSEPPAYRPAEPDDRQGVGPGPTLEGT
jgi:hypothetical protein